MALDHIGFAVSDFPASRAFYVAALAPEPGEGLEDMTRGHPPAPGLAHVRAAEGFAQLDEAGYLNDFAPDVPRARARAMYAAQGPVAADLFDWPRMAPRLLFSLSKSLKVCPERDRVWCG